MGREEIKEGGDGVMASEGKLSSITNTKWGGMLLVREVRR